MGVTWLWLRIFAIVPGIEGEMTLLPLHSALISPLKAGTIRLKKADGEMLDIAIDSGTLEISHNHATVLI